MSPYCKGSTIFTRTFHNAMHRTHTFLEDGHHRARSHLRYWNTQGLRGSASPNLQNGTSRDLADLMKISSFQMTERMRDLTSLSEDIPQSVFSPPVNSRYYTISSCLCREITTRIAGLGHSRTFSEWSDILQLRLHDTRKRKGYALDETIATLKSKTQPQPIHRV